MMSVCRQSVVTPGKLHETETEDVVSRPQHPCLRVVGGDTTSEWIDVDASVDSPTRPPVRPLVAPPPICAIFNPPNARSLLLNPIDIN